ncbi:MAG: DUF3626 domain-containing protein [Polyangiales bacterium]
MRTGPDPFTDIATARALACVEARAAAARDDAARRIATVLARHAPNLPTDVAARRVREVFTHARVTLNFHPDRFGPRGETVIEGLLREGRYRSQWTTGITNGSPTAFAGGDREVWEARLFGDAYPPHADGREASAPERPKYGALNAMGYPEGASPRFGSCALVLHPAVLSRCTFTWGDSHLDPAHVGTARLFDGVLAAWLEAARDGAALGRAIDVPTLLAHDFAATSTSPGRALDDYIEAQVHGPIDLATDLDAILVDPSFHGTETGAALLTLGDRAGVPVRAHAGFAMVARDVPDDFRGPRMRPLAARIVGEARLDAAALGRAARSLHTSPATWSDWGTPQETWQHLKQLWHVLVRFGGPLAP